MIQASPRRTIRLQLAVAMACLLVVLCASACSAYSPGDPEFRAFWVDTWHNGALSQSDVDQLLGVPGDPTSLGDIREANCNAVFIQVRRNADACYPSSMGEPYMSGLSPADFNSLQAVIAAAHDTTGGKKRVEVHCWIVTFRTSGGTVYARHNNPADPANYWVSLDDAGKEVTDRAFDPGHPNCEEYTVGVVMDLVNNFDIDGIHFDYIRFTANNQGYNPTSVARYNARYGLTGKPGPKDEQFKQWRRDQVTALVRKTYAKIQAVKPWVKQSGSFVTWNPSPVASTREAFMNTRPYYDVYCDWDSWLQEGIVDAAVPMTYYDLSGSYPNDWARWMNFEKDRHSNRHMYIGPGIYMNYLDDAITELLQTREPSPAGNYAQGFSGYSYAAPYAISKSSSTYGTWSTFKTDLLSQVTSTPANVPAMPWKIAPTKGHISGTVTHFPTGAWADGATVTLVGPENRQMLTDGTGFYAFIDLTPGTYTLSVSMDGCQTAQRTVNVQIGEVTGNMYVTDIPIVTAPFISDVHIVTIGADSATIGWTTDQPSTSQIEYGVSTSYGQTTAIDPAVVTTHTATVAGLLPNTLYHYRVVSSSANGTRRSADYTFTSGSQFLTLVSNPAAGGTCSGGGWYAVGEEVTVKATMSPEYSFLSWSTSPDGTGVMSASSTYKFVMPNQPHTLYANFQLGVPDIVVEAWDTTYGAGANPQCYSERGEIDELGRAAWGHSSAKSTAAGLTAGIGSRYGLIDITVDKDASYKPAISVDGRYGVYSTWGSSSNGGSSIKHTVDYLDGQYTKTFNQNKSANLYNKWNLIGTFPFASGNSGECGGVTQWAAVTQAGKRIMADAIKWVYAGPMKAVEPTPADGTIEVSTSNPTLSWSAGGTTQAYDVYLGTNTDSMTLVSADQGGTTYSPDNINGSTIYYWRVDSKAFGKTTTGDIWSFTTAAATPVLLNVQATNVTATSATITWGTDQPTTTQVSYGTTSAYGQTTTEDMTLVSNHSVTLSNLTANTMYHFKAKSTSGLGLTGYSADLSFCTKPPALTFVIDNLQGTTSGTWSSLSDTGGWPTDASQYLYSLNTSTSTTATFTWTPRIPVRARYNVYGWYKSGTDRTMSARYTVAYSGGQMAVAVVNQMQTGSQWVPLVTSKLFDAGTSGYVQLTNKTGETDATKKVVADAIKFEFAENDVTPPSVPTNVVATAASTSQINLTWTASTDDISVMGYRVFRNGKLIGLSTTPSYSDTGLDINKSYSYSVLAYDEVGNESAQCSPVARYTLAPAVTAANVTCDRVAGQYYGTPTFNFTNTGTGTDKVSSYRYVWDNSPTHTWTNTEASWIGIRVSLNAATPQAWYLHVNGYNGDGISSGTLDMGPYYYGATYDSIDSAMNNPNGRVVVVQSWKPIIAAFSDCFYIEEPNRTRGLRVQMNTTLPVGTSVKVGGKLAAVNGERCLTEPAIIDSTPGTAPGAIMMRNSVLGGGRANAYTVAFPGVTGPYTVGLLVRVLGTVLTTSTGSYLLQDPSGTSVTVYSDKAVQPGQLVAATGVCSLESGDCVVRTRTVDDTTIYKP